MKNLHTPGNWTADKSNGNSPYLSSVFSTDRATDGMRKCIATLVGSRLDLIPIDEREANARLIAAAPDLLKALQLTLMAMQDLVTQLPVDENIADYRLDLCERAETEAKAAISKAQHHE